MARPIKLNADYFPHDADMRNDTRIKALRRKFGLEGYAVYVMMVELLTDSDNFRFKNDSLSIELVAGDFDCDPEKLTQILQYCFQIDLFQIDAETNEISCKSLDKRLESLLWKRKRDRNDIIVVDNTQSKAEQSKGKKKKVEQSKIEETVTLRALPFGESFEKVWNEWLKFRKEKRQPIKPTTEEKQLKFLGARPEAEAIEILEQSMMNGWTGLFELKKNGKTTDVQDLKNRIKNL